MTTLLIDGDIFIYKAALSAQTAVDFGEGQWGLAADLPTAQATFDETIGQLQSQLNADKLIIALSDRQNFRKEIMPSYKANRKNTQRPLLLEPLRQYVRETQNFFERPFLEADDVLGILATNNKVIKGEKIVVSTDKDLRTIPCTLFNPNQMDEPEDISEQEADYSFHVQILTGDPVDGYGGCPKVGAVKAAKILSGAAPIDYWPLIVEQFEKAGLDEEAALQTARVARILRTTDYDYKEKKPCLWTPKKPQSLN